MFTRLGLIEVTNSVKRYFIVLLVLNALVTFLALSFAGNEIVFALTNRAKVDALIEKMDGQIISILSTKIVSEAEVK